MSYEEDKPDSASPSGGGMRSKNKVLELDEYFSTQASNAGVSQSAEKHFGIDNHEIANALFSKASVSFLSSKTVEDLGAITLDCVSLCNSLVESDQKFLVNISPSKHYSTLSICLGDRPFTINSIVECIRKFESDIQVLLHPLFTAKDGQRISYIHAEIDPLPAQKLEILRDNIVMTINDLIIATDDFASILVRTQTNAKVLEQSKNISSFSQFERQEAADFLRWLTDDGFVFLGFAEWKVIESSNGLSLEHNPQSCLGIFRSDNAFVSLLEQESRDDALTLIDSNELVAFVKLRSESIVQRGERMDNVVVKEFSPDGKLVSVHSIIGLLTSRALSQESSSIPLVRRKIEKLMQIEDLLPHSHDYKNVVGIIDRMPKEEVMRLEIEELREDIAIISGIQRQSETRASIRMDKASRGVSIMVAMPHNRFNEYVRNRIQEHLEAIFGAAPGSSQFRLALSTKPLVIFYYYIPIAAGILPPINLAKLEAEIVDLTRTWRDNLRETIFSSELFDNPEEIWEKYGDAFPEEYQASQTVSTCEKDISIMEKLDGKHPIQIGIFPRPDSASGFFDLALYNLGDEITLSQALPILENAGLYIIDQKSTHIAPRNEIPVFVHRFLAKPKQGSFLDMEAFYRYLAPGLVEVFSNRVDNDILNSLMLHANLDIRAISLLRSYCFYLWQITKFASPIVIKNTLASVPSAAAQLWNMFEIRFNPHLRDPIKSRDKRLEVAINHFNDSLRDVPDITKDRILRILVNLVSSTVRTNYYQERPSIALKIESKSVEVLKPPLPYYEIFVSSIHFEGVHLRGGAVARGGIRWSDRNEDYRSEILDLMKTQRIKNALIVPTGAKGGFVVRKPASDPDETRHIVEDCYREFIRSLLSLTDNRLKNSIVHPDNSVVYDQPDPYLVVAADKGTATFSDIANKIAVKEYNYWLGDAFASGGSHGYDHKLHGITARGAWESVKRHFNDLGLDYENVPFTCIGIGDMAGDVFGNGMLQSDKIKLIAAFNHMHIFVDPDPDCALSFQERKRLFNLPGSNWLDYNRKLISAGGGIFKRTAKEIEVTDQMRQTLSIPADIGKVINGEYLISIILKAKCDLLWNGGIGTYVKSESESHANVNDGANDSVRINAAELRATVIGEGGNLGLTQKARVEFNKRGGYINLDAVDNSGGVDLSDREVNLKILLSAMIDNGELELSERNSLLKQMGDECCYQVLDDNKSQALSLTLGMSRSVKRMNFFKSLIRDLVREGYVNRTIDQLPDDEELGRRANRQVGLTRPELGIIFSAVKMWLKDVMLETDLAEHELLSSFLYDYFPVKMRERYISQIREHPLAREIVVTQAINNIVDIMGATFVHRTALNHSVSPADVIKYYLAAENILDASSIRADLKRLDDFENNTLFLQSLQLVNKALYQTTSWLISCHGSHFPLDELVKIYKPLYQELLENIAQVLKSDYRQAYLRRLESGASPDLADFSLKSLALFADILPAMGILWAAQTTGRSLEDVSKMYSQVLKATTLRKILRHYEDIETPNQWERELLFRSLTEIRKDLFIIAGEFLNQPELNEKAVKERIKNKMGIARLKHFVREVRDEIPTVAAVAVIAQQLKTCVD